MVRTSRAESWVRNSPADPADPADSAEMVRSSGSAPPFHAQESQDDVSSQANSFKLTFFIDLRT